MLTKKKKKKYKLEKNLNLSEQKKSFELNEINSIISQLPINIDINIMIYNLYINIMIYNLYNAQLLNFLLIKFREYYLLRDSKNISKLEVRYFPRRTYTLPTKLFTNNIKILSKNLLSYNNPKKRVDLEISEISKYFMILSYKSKKMKMKNLNQIRYSLLSLDLFISSNTLINICKWQSCFKTFVNNILYSKSNKSG